MSDFFDTVNVSTPIENAQVASPVHIAATTTDSSPVSSVQIYVDDILQYKVSGSSLDTLLPMSTGNHHIVVQSWDTAGGIHKRGVDVNVAAQEVSVSSPAPNAVVSSPVLVSGTAKGKSQVYTMQVYVDDVLKYQWNSNSISEHLSMAAGSHHVVLQAWDTGGGITKTGVYITVATPSISIAAPLSGANTYSPVQVVAAALDPAGLAAVQVYVDNILKYEMTGTGVAAPVPMSVGPHYVAVQAWNKLGKTYVKGVNINVLPIIVTISPPPANGTVDSPVHIQASAPKDSTVFTMQVYVDNVLQYQVGGTSADV